MQRLEAELLDGLLSLLGSGGVSRRRIGNLIEGEGSSYAMCLFVDATSIAELEEQVSAGARHQARDLQCSRY